MKKGVSILTIAALAFSLASPALAQNGVMSLTGAGATFPFPIYSKWFDEYHKMKSNVQINYQSIGSGGGIRQITAGTVDFGATDGPMTDAQLAQSKVQILHIPTVLGAVVPIYNIPGVSAELNFSRDALAGIYLGTIKKWNDPAITKHNPNVRLPGENIVVVRRSDGSGTTYIWTDFLSKVSDQWKNGVGNGTSVNWPVGLGGKGNEGVSGLVKQTPNSIGYVELIYALQNNLSYGRVQNAANVFVKADLAATTAAAAGAAKSMPADFRVSITNAPGKGTYPIVSFTWLLVPTTIQDAGKKTVIKDFLKWMATDGQTYASQLGYAPLPKEVATKVIASLDKVK
ncbi:MAG: phosphate ABC transporter substrate-binding protein PstS [Acidobacteria bacterium]|nr:phosphate ABC transporter substrate-binding protein PstS [Acidobacteriota bacterium]MCL5287096.1 phosphate ABC transporter substrate-binding protein PstS [Acidobacteriota bacterium]